MPAICHCIWPQFYANRYTFSITIFSNPPLPPFPSVQTSARRFLCRSWNHQGLAEATRGRGNSGANSPQLSRTTKTTLMLLLLMTTLSGSFINVLNGVVGGDSGQSCSRWSRMQVGRRPTTGETASTNTPAAKVNEARRVGVVVVVVVKEISIVS